MNTMLVTILLMIMNTLGMNTVSVDQLELELNEEAKVQEARSNGIEILQPIEIYFMYGNEEGTYWLDPNSENENVIYVDYESLAEWNIEYNELHHGYMMVGLFDETGWELIEMISEEDLMNEAEMNG